jgi:hypothetical protein
LSPPKLKSLAFAKLNKGVFRFFLAWAMLYCLVLPLVVHAKSLPLDQGPVEIRRIPDSAIQQYKLDPTFDYSQGRAGGMSLWDRFWNWVFNSIGKIEQNHFWSLFFKGLLWGLCIFGLVYAVARLTGINTIFSRNLKAEQIEYEVGQEDIYKISFEEEIQKSIEQRNFRMAIRLYFLQSLRQLADKEMIHWRQNKTNEVYLRELEGSPYYSEFVLLTRTYEFAWYGEMPLEEGQFRNAQNHFVQFHQSLPL